MLPAGGYPSDMNWDWPRRKQRAGWVAEYCVICRDVHPHQVVHGRDDRGNALPPAVDCASCSLSSTTNASRYLTVLTKLPETLTELVARTFPRLPLAVGGRILWEKEAIRGALQPPERQQAIQEPFLILSYLARRNYGIGAFLGFSVLFTVLSFIPMTIAAVTLFPARTQDRALGVLIWVGIAGSVALAAWIVRRNRRRSGKRVILPMLSKSLRPLRPSIDELREIAEWAKGMRQPIGMLFDANELFEAISRQTDRSLVHADEMDLIGQAQRMQAELNPTRDGELSSESGDDPEVL